MASSSSSNAVHFVVGNTYSKVPLSEAKLDRSGSCRKVHDWTLFVDVVEGNVDAVVERVSFDLGGTFQPSTFVCSTPIPIQGPNGSIVWRFQTRQQTYGSITAKIQLRGVGGSTLECSHNIRFAKAPPTSSMNRRTFRETRPPRPLRMLKMPDGQRFGIELELTAAVSAETVARNLETNAMPVEVVTDYSAGRETSWHWKLVPDSSIVCNTNMPNCNRFELVSPVLQGGRGLDQVSQILQRLNDYSRREPQVQLAVNKSMGFHVHMDVASLSNEELVKVCQNFIKYEAVMDTFMPNSRRNGSPESSRYFQSNRTSVAQQVGSNANKRLHDALGACSDVESLAQLMNASGRYYKLNLQNLVSTRRYQPTLEFRQHSATTNFQKVGAWARFCHAFVSNSAKLAPPRSFRQGRSIDFQCDALFQYVIKDRALRNFYQARRQELASSSDDEEACCSECARGGRCNASQRPPTVYSTGFCMITDSS